MRLINLTFSLIMFFLVRYTYSQETTFFVKPVETNPPGMVSGAITHC
jgi:hypothetical protein